MPKISEKLLQIIKDNFFTNESIFLFHIKGTVCTESIIALYATAPCIKSHLILSLNSVLKLFYYSNLPRSRPSIYRLTRTYALVYRYSKSVTSNELYKATKMVKILRDIIIRDDLRKIYGQPFGYQVKYLWRKGWEEIPELMVFIPPTVVSLFGLVWVVRAQLEEAKRLPRYFNDITIFRPNDPKVARIRTDDRLSVECKH